MATVLCFFFFFFVVLPSAIVTVYDHKEKMEGMLENYPNQDSVTVFLAEVPKEIVLSSDLECRMVDLEKVMDTMHCLLTFCLRMGNYHTCRFS